jgi:hypothetical protein
MKSSTEWGNSLITNILDSLRTASLAVLFLAVIAVSFTVTLIVFSLTGWIRGRGN